MNILSSPLSAVVAFLFLASPVSGEPLPSWNDGASRDEILDFVQQVTKEGGADFVRPEDRIAVFDNDGTLWAERPIYFQFLFAIDRVKAMAPEHPEWKSQEPFASALKDDLRGVAASGKEGLMKLLMATHSNMTIEEFDTLVESWIATARHPRFGRPYTELVYQPMLEVLEHLRNNGFQTWIISGGGVEFMRVFAEEVYGIPPQQVVGSSIVTEFQIADGIPKLVRQPKLNFFDDKEGKPVAIHQHIGKRPIAVFGNSDGDQQMLQWGTIAEGRRLGVLVRHTDEKREWAYDRESHIGRLDQALDEASARGWTIVDMKRDWKRIFAHEE
jgi:phosphoserine phosphatase